MEAAVAAQLAGKSAGTLTDLILSLVTKGELSTAAIGNALADLNGHASNAADRKPAASLGSVKRARVENDSGHTHTAGDDADEAVLHAEHDHRKVSTAITRHVCLDMMVNSLICLYNP
jgi:hypothetical protein